MFRVMNSLAAYTIPLNKFKLRVNDPLQNNLIPSHQRTMNLTPPTCCQPQILDRNSPTLRQNRYIDPELMFTASSFIGEIRVDLGGCKVVSNLMPFVCLPHRC